MQLLVVQFLERFAEKLFNGIGLPAEAVSSFKVVFFILVLVVLSWVANWIAKQVILVVLTKVIRRSPNRWDDVFLDKKVFSRMSHLAPVVIIFWFGRALLSEYPELVDRIYLITNVYIIIVVTMVSFAVLNALETIYENFDISKTRPIKGYMQVLKILGIFVVVILIFSLVLDRSPRLLLTGLGAASAVLMLIFRDTILNFVGGVQVTANNLVQIGDWIEMPKYGADGDVIEINLNTVKVQNFDRTITTIPTYALVSDSFRNWRGMVQSGGRRIKRAINIDAKSIKVCDEEMLEKFEKVYLLKDYIKQKKEEVEKYNRENDFDGSISINGRRLTNIGTFRAYIKNYLANHPHIHKDMIFMVRQLAPSEKGVPLEVYAFTNDIAWVNYESIQSDIFDHILSRISFFDLKVFQDPSEISFNIGQLTTGKEGDGKEV
ncbi:MAG: mechanosensitive ion channel domain-containing protein [Bacteroides sp.]|jgi:miniconductance mechanosensitive channel|nr:mechanosensitive ion channel domain-containing protein [Bacteroides sp.]